MLRRHLPSVLLASAATGAVALPRNAQAQTCTLPCYPQTAAETSAGVTPANTNYLPGDVRRYGASGNGSTDDTAALQAALTVANAAGYVMYLPAGTYKISSQLQKLQSFSCPNIRGDGSHYSRINYSSFGATAAVYIQGGSGRACGASIEGIGFDGSSTSYAIEVDGQDGVVIRDCEFSQNAVGLRLNNKTSGSFTEYVVAENCVFNNSCATALQYLVSGGSNSFHGSGLRYCLIQAGTSGVNPIYIGAGAVPYNAPLSFQIWTSMPAQTVIWNASANPVIFHGTITVEPAAAQNQSQSPILAGGQAVYLVGGVESNAYVNYGTLFTGFRAGSLGPESNPANGQHLIKTHPWTVRRALTTGSNVIGYIGGDSSRLIYAQLVGANYDYRYMLIASHNGFGQAGYAQVITVLRTFNQAGYGAPMFSVDANGNFAITNSGFPSSGVTAYIDMMPFGLSIMGYGVSAAEYGNV